MDKWIIECAFPICSIRSDNFPLLTKCLSLISLLGLKNTLALEYEQSNAEKIMPLYGHHKAHISMLFTV